MAVRTRLLIIVGMGLAAFAAGMAVVWVRSQPERKFDKQAYLDEMKTLGKSLDKKPAQATEPVQGVEGAAEAAKEGGATAQPPQSPAPQGDQPKIQVDGETFDLGTIPNDKPTTKKMPIRNVGTAPLQILRLGTSCGCTKVELKETDKTIPPGGQVEADVTIDPKRVHAFDSSKELTIISNDPTNKLKIQVCAKIDPEFELVPAELDFGALAKGETKEMTLVVRQIQEGKVPFELKGVECQSPAKELQASYEKVPEDKWQTLGKAEYLVKVVLNTESAPAFFGPDGNAKSDYSGFLFLDTTCERVGKFRYRAAAKIDSFFSVSPNAIPIYTSQPGQNQAAQVTVAGNAPITVEDLKVTGGEMTATAVPGPKPNTVLVQVSVDNKAAVGAKEERLSFVVKSGEKTGRHCLRVYGRLVDHIAKQRTHDVKKRRSGDQQGAALTTPGESPQPTTETVSQ